MPQAVREIAWKAQSRLNQRYRALLRRGKLKNIAITAVAREFVGSLPSRNCFAVFVKIVVVVFSNPVGIRDLSILFDDARIFGVKLRITA